MIERTVVCNETFLAKNINTRRCDTCKVANPKPPKTFTRNCCECGNEFTSRNIYTVTCSQKCGTTASLNGNAAKAKQQLKDLAREKRELSKTIKESKKEQYLDSLWDEDKLLSTCYERWSEYQFKIGEYKGYHSKIEVICKDHGSSFISFRGNRYPKTPCKQCKVNHNIKGHSELLSRCREKFGDRYEYLNTFRKITDKLEIVCPDHGNVQMAFRSHMNSPTGCPECSKEIQDFARSSGCYNWTLLERDTELASKSCSVYFVSGQEYMKVGITTSGNGKRRKSLKYESKLDNFETIFSGTLIECFELEQLILSEADKYIPEEKFGGYTECFTSSFQSALRSGKELEAVYE